MQVAPPAEVYERPNSCWVADFVGDINLFEGRVGEDGVSVEGTPLGWVHVAEKIEAEPGTMVWVAVRPEKMRITRSDPSADGQAGSENRAAATIVDVGYLGDLTIYKLRTDAGVPLQAALANTGRTGEDGIGWGDKVWLSFSPAAVIVLTR